MIYCEESRKALEKELLFGKQLFRQNVQILKQITSLRAEAEEINQQFMPATPKSLVSRRKESASILDDELHRQRIILSNLQSNRKLKSQLERPLVDIAGFSSRSSRKPIFAEESFRTNIKPFKEKQNKLDKNQESILLTLDSYKLISVQNQSLKLQNQKLRRALGGRNIPTQDISVQTDIMAFNQLKKKTGRLRLTDKELQLLQGGESEQEQRIIREIECRWKQLLMASKERRVNIEHE